MRIVLFFSFITLMTFNVIAQPKNNKFYRETPGEELEVYSIHHYKGVIATSIGTPITTLGVYLLSKSKSVVNQPVYNWVYNNGNYTQELVGYQNKTIINKQQEKEGIFGVFVGGIITAVGMYYLIESPIHIKRAGILLNENGVGVKIKIQ